MRSAYPRDMICTTVAARITSLLLLGAPTGIQKHPKACWGDIWQLAWSWINFTSTSHELLGSLDGEDLFSDHIGLIARLRETSLPGEVIDANAAGRTVRGIITSLMTMLRISVDLPDETAYPAMRSFLLILCADFSIGGLAPIPEAIIEGFIRVIFGRATSMICAEDR
ncbi:hypothetical protein DFH08DRAFT_1082379 [Mycena albidolilacea]|uniref:Uncharacterized protein n=1 Tax=Mycena albidolilacea TaxID=1033008 RepID=A0AAD7EM77_9AGAR|nr:hypothetical protein DFH08DRAFT_1082379 [Mycena albidolilacea]